MASVTFNKKIFEKEIGKVDEEMQERIALFGTPLEKIDSEEIEVEIFPNRPDLLSYQGYKRSFLAFLGKKPGLKNYKINKPEKDYEVIIESSVKNVRPFTACAIVKNLKLDDEKIKEIIGMQEKLHATIGRKRKKIAMGIYPLEKIKLPIYYRALEPDKIKFAPLGSDKEMSGLEILERHPTGKEYSNLLAGKSKFPIFVDSDKNILSMPPILNSQLTGKVNQNTKDVFVECSGLDFDILKKCLNIVVTTLADMGGEIYQMDLKYSKKETTPNLNPEKMKISLENTNKLLGLNLNEKQIKTLLEKMGHNYDKGHAEIPSWRTDVLHEVDLIEDVAIAYGYENFEPEIPKVSTIGEESQREILKKKIADVFSGLNMLEVSNYHLTTKKDQFEKMGILEKQEKEFAQVTESKTDYTILRKDLTHYLLKIFSDNIDAEYPQRIFEIGKTFRVGGWGERLHDRMGLGGKVQARDAGGGKDFPITEEDRLSVAISPGNFTELKQIIEYFFRTMNVKVSLKETENCPGHFIEGRTASIFLDEKEIGFIGEIHPKILKNWKLKMPVALFEIGLEEIFKH
jgi:phenylalanyl-tRNA synthetase beta chain